MNIAVEKEPKCIAILKVEVPAKDVSSKRDTILAKYASQAKIPGFRPGKTPKKVVAKRFEKEIKEQLNEDIYNEACQLALSQENLRVLEFGSPNDFAEIEDGTITFHSKLILAPEFQLPEYKGIEVKTPPAEITEEELSAQLEQIRERFADFEDISDRPIQDDDIAVIDFTSTVDGKPLTEVIGEKGQYLAKREDHWVPIKESEFLPGLAQQLIGLNIGDEKDVVITLNEDFAFKELHGKELTLHTTIKGVKKPNLPELNDELAEKIVPGSSLDEVKRLIRESLAEKKEQGINDLKVNQIVEHLNKNVSFDLPDEILQRETQNQANALVEEGQRKGATNEQMVEQQDEIFSVASTRASTNLKTNFLLQEIAAAEKITVSDADLLAHIQKMAEQRQQPVKTLLTELQKNRQINAIRNSLVIGQTIDFLLDQANITEVSTEEMKASQES